MQKIDFKRELKQLYRPPAKAFSVVDVPAMQFLMIDGHGDPNTAEAYKEAVEALYGVAYKLKWCLPGRSQSNRDSPLTLQRRSE